MWKRCESWCWWLGGVDARLRGTGGRGRPSSVIRCGVQKEESVPGGQSVGRAVLVLCIVYMKSFNTTCYYYQLWHQPTLLFH